MTRNFLATVVIKKVYQPVKLLLCCQKSNLSASPSSLDCSPGFITHTHTPSHIYSSIRNLTLQGCFVTLCFVAVYPQALIALWPKGREVGLSFFPLSVDFMTSTSYSVNLCTWRDFTSVWIISNRLTLMAFSYHLLPTVLSMSMFLFVYCLHIAYKFQFDLSNSLKPKYDRFDLKLKKARPKNICQFSIINELTPKSHWYLLINTF